MKKPSRQPKADYQEFVFHVGAPSLSYGFGINHDRKAREWRPFDEQESVRFTTECIWPDRFKGRQGEGALHPEPALVDQKLLTRDDVRRKWIGYIQATKSKFDIVLWLPPAACWRLGEAMMSGLARSMSANTMVEPRGMHRVTHISFEGQEFDPVAYVGSPSP